jgi:hypothetical protein
MSRDDTTDEPLFTAVAGLRRRKRLSASVAALNLGLFYASIVTVAIGILSQFGIIPYGFAIAGGVLGIALVAGVLFGILRSPSDERLLLDADGALGLKERLYTAHRVRAGKEQTAYKDILLEDAEERARNVEPGKVYPLDRTEKFRITPFLVLIAVVLLTVDFSGFGQRDPRVVDEGEFIEEFGKRLAARADRESLPGSQELAEELQRLGRRLQNEKLSQAESQEMIKKLSDRVEEQIDNIQRDLTAGVEQSDFELDEETQESLQEMRRGEMSSAEIVELRQRILNKKGLTSRQRDDVQESFEQYEQNPSEDAQSDLADELSQELGDYGDDFEDGHGQNYGEELENYEAANNMMRRSADTLAQGNKRQRSGNMQGQSGDSDFEGGMSAGEMAGAGGEAAGEGSDGDQEDTQEEGDGSSNTPGRNAEADRFDESFSPSGDWKPIEELKGLINPERNMRAFVRTMPKLDEERQDLTTEDILLSYQSRYEEVIQKEDIPPNMKEYIRDYFINIGIGQEEKE